MTGGNGFEADPAALARHAAEFPAFADRAHAIHGELASALAATGDCWGGDAAGQSFASGHLPAADDTLGQLGSLSGKLTDVGDRFAGTAASYRQVDQASADRLDGRP